jgi:hypothetical protein
LKFPRMENMKYHKLYRKAWKEQKKQNYSLHIIMYITEKMEFYFQNILPIIRYSLCDGTS